MGGVALFLTVLLFHSRTSIPSAVSCHLLTESSFRYLSLEYENNAVYLRGHMRE